MSMRQLCVTIFSTSGKFRLVSSLQNYTLLLRHTYLRIILGIWVSKMKGRRMRLELGSVQIWSPKRSSCHCWCCVLFYFETEWGGPLPECSCTPCLPGGPPGSHHPTHMQRHSKGNDMRTIPVYLVTRLYTNCTCVKVQSSVLSYLLYVCCLHFKYWHLNEWQTMLGCLE